MLGPRLNTVFSSRWKALLWAASILLTAYCTVPTASDISEKNRQDQAPAPHSNPWAK